MPLPRWRQEQPERAAAKNVNIIQLITEMVENLVEVASDIVQDQIDFERDRARYEEYIRDHQLLDPNAYDYLPEVPLPTGRNETGYDFWIDSLMAQKGISRAEAESLAGYIQTNYERKQRGEAPITFYMPEDTAEYRRQNADYMRRYQDATRNLTNDEYWDLDRHLRNQMRDINRRQRGLDTGIPLLDQINFDIPQHTPTPINRRRRYGRGY